ncbi:MAG TPA: hypothetical protein PKJ25_09170 [Smithellaceae bacterium]|nr:hypothetical protein [Smithellaceae bacterium]
MTYQLTVSQNPAYLHIIVTGQNSVENVLKYFEDIHLECTVRNCFSILIEERLDGPRLSTINIFNIVQNESIRSRGFFKVIAYVDVNGNYDSMKFAETVAVNRGLPVAVFQTIAEAQKWMKDKYC